MKGKDEIQNLFSDKLGGYEAKVNPELWGKVASQIGAGSAATATGMALTTKLIIGLGAASVLTVASFVAFDSEEEVTTNENQKETAQVETSKEVTAPIINKEPTQSTVLESVETNNIVAPQPENNYVVTIEEFIPKPFVVEEDHILFEDNPIQNAFRQQPVPAPEVGQPVPEVVDPVLISIPSEDIVTEESTEIELVFPNIFTPNGDGANDYLFISNSESLQEEGFLVRIINSNYKEVFTSSNPNFKWDGRDMGGEELPNGFYIAFVTSKDSKGHEAKPVMFQFEIKK